ncbi:MAG: hypothetical protein IKQ91_07200 [Oscillospiraceae bacterium]|nr:hypothetical protein [Oscillospiraceae bacterium]
MSSLSPLGGCASHSQNIQPSASLRLHTAFAPFRRTAVFCIGFHDGIAPAYPAVRMLLATQPEAKGTSIHTEHTVREPSPMNGMISAISMGLTHPF